MRLLYQGCGSSESKSTSWSSSSSLLVSSSYHVASYSSSTSTSYQQQLSSMRRSKPLFSEQMWILFSISRNCVFRKTFVADLNPRVFLVLFFSEIPSQCISRSTMLVLLLFDFRSASSSFLLLHLVAGADPLNRYAGFL